MRYKFKMHSFCENVQDFFFTKEFPSAYVADRWASRTITNRSLAWCVIFLAGEEG